uniref:Uncharacterized protein n=1 Tax=Knipowitschia caucasica TaxID=637954 RepID=A0AAV2LKC7_KNICA
MVPQIDDDKRKAKKPQLSASLTLWKFLERDRRVLEAPRVDCGVLRLSEEFLSADCLGNKREDAAPHLSN